MRVGNTFNCSANTESGRVYALQYNDSLVTKIDHLFMVPGTGAERVFIDPTGALR